MLKRVKVSEHEEVKISGMSNFQLGESAMSHHTSHAPVRKSIRKRKKSKVLREVEEEDMTSLPKPKSVPKSKKEFTKFSELSEKARKREEKVSAEESSELLVQFQYDFEMTDPKPVCFCQTCSYGEMVA